MTSVFNELPREHFACVLADPPWRFSVWSKKGLGRSADRYYPTLTLRDIAAFPIADIAARDAFLFLWVPGPILAIGAHLDIMAAWGFTPSSMMFTWAKLTKAGTRWHVGLGYTSRHNAEFCIVGRRGKPRRLDRSIRELIVAPINEHSRKPIEAHERIERFCAGPRLELFARRRPSTAHGKDWTVFGNQLEKLPGTAVA